MSTIVTRKKIRNCQRRGSPVLQRKIKKNALKAAQMVVSEKVTASTIIQSTITESQNQDKWERIRFDNSNIEPL